MAKFNAVGFEDLALSMQEFAAIPDDVIEKILDAGGEVVVDAHKHELRSMGHSKSGKLVRSIEAINKVGKRSGEQRRYVLVYPTGTHHMYNRREVKKIGYGYKYGRQRRNNRRYTVGGDRKAATNNDVGFVLEFGARKRGIKARQWMSTANIKSANKRVAAEYRVYDEWLKSKNL